MGKTAEERIARLRRHRRVRKKVSGTAGKPRLSVFRSTNHIYAQLIDDVKGTTLVSASSLDSEIKPKIGSGGNIEAAKQVGALVAKRALEKK
ncbi:50S ribosomal protein L18, partial [Candidatus Aquicultor secundus]